MNDERAVEILAIMGKLFLSMEDRGFAKEILETLVMEAKQKMDELKETLSPEELEKADKEGQELAERVIKKITGS